MVMILNPFCANPQCYRKAEYKHKTKIGNLIVEVGLCPPCNRKADENALH
jgi:hypothetical protein